MIALNIRLQYSAPAFNRPGRHAKRWEEAGMLHLRADPLHETRRHLMSVLMRFVWMS